MTLSSPYVWIRPEDVDFLQATREALAIERKAYAAADAERKALRERRARMSLSDVKTAGAFAEALDAVRRAVRDLAEKTEDEPEEWVGVALLHEISEAGASHLTDDVIVPQELAKEVLEFLWLRIAQRLDELGVKDIPIPAKVLVPKP